jgi:predicted GIY-YIG superfamily endonuclease
LALIEAKSASDRLGCCLAAVRRMHAKHIVYVLRSVSKPHRPYIGLTHDVEARLAAHNEGRCAHTARYRPWEVVAAIVLADEPTAIRFERYLKSGSGRAFAKRHFG